MFLFTDVSQNNDIINVWKNWVDRSPYESSFKSPTAWKVQKPRSQRQFCQLPFRGNLCGLRGVRRRTISPWMPKCKTRDRDEFPWFLPDLWIQRFVGNFEKIVQLWKFNDLNNYINANLFSNAANGSVILLVSYEKLLTFILAIDFTEKKSGFFS